MKKLLGCILCLAEDCQRPRLNYDSNQYEWAASCQGSPARLERQLGGRYEMILKKNGGGGNMGIRCFQCHGEDCFMWHRHGPTCRVCDKPLLSRAILANQSLNTCQ